MKRAIMSLVLMHLLGASLAAAPAAAPALSVGDTIKTTANLNVRVAAGTGQPEIASSGYPGYAPAGTMGKVVAGPVSANGSIWYKVDYGPGRYAGWSIGDGLQRTQPAGTAPQPAQAAPAPVAPTATPRTAPQPAPAVAPTPAAPSAIAPRPQPTAPQAGSAPTAAPVSSFRPPQVVTLTLYVHADSSTGPVLQGALVTYKDAAGRSFAEVTNASGFVTLMGAPGSWQIIASKAGYRAESWSQAVTGECSRHAFLQTMAASTPAAQPSRTATAPVSPRVAGPSASPVGGGVSPSNTQLPSALPAAPAAAPVAAPPVVIAHPQPSVPPSAPAPSSPAALQPTLRSSPTSGPSATARPADASAPVQPKPVPAAPAPQQPAAAPVSAPIPQAAPQVTLTLYVHAGSTTGPVLQGVRITGKDGSGRSFDQVTGTTDSATLTGVPGTWQFTASRAGYQGATWTIVTATACTQHAFLQSAAAPTPVLSTPPSRPQLSTPLAPFAQSQTRSQSDSQGVLNAIRTKLTTLPAYPQYLHGTGQGVRGAIADAAVQLANRQRLDEYDRWYQATVDYRSLAEVQLRRAERLARAGDSEGARRFLQDSDRCLKLYYLANDAATSVYEAGVEKAAYYAKAVYETSRAAFVLTSSAAGLGPVASVLADHLYTATDFAVNTSEMGFSKAAKQAVVDIIAQQVGKEMVKEIAGTGLKGAGGAKPTVGLKDLLTRLARDNSFCTRVVKSVAQGTSQEISTDLVSKLMSDVAAQTSGNP